MSAQIGLGLQLTLYGMGLVFLLLAALWGLIELMGWLDRRAPAAVPEAPPPAAAQPEIQTGLQPSPELLAAISVAVLAHRAISRRQAAPAIRSHPPGSLPSRWLALGRGQQITGWHPRRQGVGR